MTQALITASIATLAAGSLFAQSFEVASVRQHQGAPAFRSGPLTVAGRLIRLSGYTVYGLILDAYHVRDFQIMVAPGAVSRQEDLYDTTYDVVARAPDDGAPRIDEVRAMLRNLLAERFGLQVSSSTKEMPVYILTVAKGGPRLKASSQAGSCVLTSDVAADGRNNVETFTGCPIERLADRLRNGDRPVIDATGLAGTYDFRLIAVPDFKTRAGSDPADISPLTAVGELGLKLTSQKSNVEILRVNHLGKLKEN
jgi:uncharacterized protein (TIGR03435 family)